MTPCAELVDQAVATAKKFRMQAAWHCEHATAGDDYERAGHQEEAIQLLARAYAMAMLATELARLEEELTDD